MNAGEFLSLLFGHPSLNGLYLTIWDRQTHRTAAFALPAIEAAATNAMARADTQDVYFGVCPYREITPGSRGTAEQAGALVGLWVDIDVQGPAHKVSNLPPNRIAAFDLLYECAKPPSLVISSGYGLQAWWAFRQPMLITNDAERVEAARLAVAWTDHVKARAAKHGWHVDPTGDLARVLRLPGTKNHKQNEARPVERMSSR